MPRLGLSEAKETPRGFLEPAGYSSGCVGATAAVVIRKHRVELSNKQTKQNHKQNKNKAKS